MTPLLVRLKRWFTLPVPAAEPRIRRPLRGWRSARTAVAWFGLLTVAANVGLLVASNTKYPGLRDPEYGRRAGRLRDRLAENPGRPLVLALGSSRVGAAVKPTEWEAVRPGRPDDPLVFNVGEVGAGPLIQLLTLHRLYHDGFKPAAVLLEYWPPFLAYDEWPEWRRVDAERLLRSDLPVVREYFRDPDKVEQAVTNGWRTPIITLRQRLLIQAFPAWFPWPKRFDVAWHGLDAWGWLPGMDLPARENPERTKRLADCAGFYKANFPRYTVHPEADRYLRAAVKLARDNGAKVAFYFLPEASEFRGWYTPEVERNSREHLERLSAELAVPVIDARRWADDFHLVDGFHLSRIGAAAFTRRFVPAVTAAIPELKGKP